MSDFYHRRKIIRLREFDYSRGGYYYVTICTASKQLLLGTIINFEMKLSLIGAIVEKTLLAVPETFEPLNVDCFAIMPNHVHVIFHLSDDVSRVNLKNVVRHFKSNATREVRLKSPIQKLWQANYYEHVVRTDKSLQKLRQYISENVIKWDLDNLNPDRKQDDCSGWF